MCIINGREHPMKILVGLSGGLDSTYAALKLINEGHAVTGAVVRMHGHTEIDGAEDAAGALGIPLCVIDASDRFSAVKQNFVCEYSRGRTPNPCVVCNPWVKFRALADYARENGFDKIATGHYAQLVTDGLPLHGAHGRLDQVRRYRRGDRRAQGEGREVRR